MPFWRKGYPLSGAPQRPDLVPWRNVRPLQLKNKVSGANDKNIESVCIQEMSVMYACLKTNDFKDSLCAEQMKAYHKCVFDHLETKKKLKEQLLAGILTVNEGDRAAKLNYKQLNVVLGRYPQFNKGF